MADPKPGTILEKNQFHLDDFPELVLDTFEWVRSLPPEANITLLDRRIDPYAWLRWSKVGDGFGFTKDRRKMALPSKALNCLKL